MMAVATSMETIETDVEPMSSPVISSSKKHKEHREGRRLSDYLYLSLIVAFAIGTNQPMTLAAGFVRHGGVVFLVQFAVSLLVVGLPLFLLETAMAQFSSKGVYLQFRQAAPLFGGLASSMSFLLALRIVIISVSLSHLGSFAAAPFHEPILLPWNNCSSLPRDCFDPRIVVACERDAGDVRRPECLRQAASLALSRTTNERKTPFWSFAESTVFAQAQVISEFPNFFHSSWISLLVVWLLAAIAVIWLDQWANYMAPAVCLISFVHYSIHLGLALSLDGAFAGLQFAWKPHWKAFYSPEAWADAISHAVLVFNLGNGGVAHISSRRAFSSPLRRDVAVATACILVFYVLLHLSTFAYAGHLADLAYPDHPHAHRMRHLLEHRLHFLQFVYVENMTGLYWLRCTFHFLVEFLRGFFLLTLLFWSLLGMFRDRQVLCLGFFVGSYKWRIVALLLIGGVLSSAALLFSGVVQLVEHFVDVLTLSVAFFEIVAFSLAYGLKRLAVNLDTMSHWWRLSMNLYSVCWGVVTPTTLLTSVLMYAIAAIVAPKPLPGLLSCVGWAIVILGLSLSVIYGCTKIFKMKGDKWPNLTAPEPEWGPLLDEDRRLATQKERADRVR